MEWKEEQKEERKERLGNEHMVIKMMSKEIIMEVLPNTSENS